MNTEQKLRDLLDRLFARLLLQGVLMRALRRNPMGFLTTMLVRRVVAGDGRVFGMDLASRRQKRLGWLISLLQRYGVFGEAPRPGRPMSKRKLLR